MSIYKNKNVTLAYYLLLSLLPKKQLSARYF